MAKPTTRNSLTEGAPKEGRPLSDARKSKDALIKVAGPSEHLTSRSRDPWLERIGRIYPTLELQPLVSAEELATHLNVSEQLILLCAEELLVPGYHVGDEWRFDILEVRAALRVIATVTF